MTTQAQKECWSCHNRTPYDEGWCPECQELIPGDIEQALALALSEPFAGAMRRGVSDIIRVKRARANIRVATSKKLTKLDLNDIEI